jgi:hypothetical protein
VGGYVRTDVLVSDVSPKVLLLLLARPEGFKRHRRVEFVLAVTTCGVGAAHERLGPPMPVCV